MPAKLKCIKQIYVNLGYKVSQKAKTLKIQFLKTDSSLKSLPGKQLLKFFSPDNQE